MAIQPTPAERKVIAAARAGSTADFRTGNKEKDDPAKGANWTGSRTIRAELIYALCTGAESKWKVSHKGLKISGARITGSVDLSYASIDFPLNFFVCHFEQILDFNNAQTRSLQLRGSYLPKVNLLSSKIAGNLICSGATIINPDGDAFLIDWAKIVGGIFMDDGFNAKGEVRLVGVEIGDALDCDGAVFSNLKGDAFSFDRAKIGGTVFMSAVLNTEGKAHLNKAFEAEGTVRLVGAEIGGSLICNGASFSSSISDALCINRAKIGGDVFMGDGFKAEGDVNLLGAEIGGSCYFGKVNSDKNTRLGIVLENATIARSLIFDSSEYPPLQLNLDHAKIGSLVDCENSWPSQGYLYIDNFRYESLGGNAPKDFRSRLDWLSRQPEGDFRPQPYEQLVKVLRAMGHDRDAREIAITKQKEIRKRGLLSFRGSAWNLVLELTIGYGYKPWRAFICAAILIVIGTTVFHCAYEADLFVPSRERIYLYKDWTGSAKAWLPPEYPNFNSVIYAADVLLPIDLHEKGYWEPNESKPWGTFLKFVEAFYIFLGWLLASLAFVGFTGLIKKD